MAENELQENYQDLCGIIGAVENSQPNRARDLAQRHVKRFIRYMKMREDASAGR